MEHVPKTLPDDHELFELAERLETEYRERVERAGGGFGVWLGGTRAGVEILLGGRIGPVDGTSIKYARRTGPLGLWGRRIALHDIGEIERELREFVDSWLRDQSARGTR